MWREVSILDAFIYLWKMRKTLPISVHILFGFKQCSKVSFCYHLNVHFMGAATLCLIVSNGVCYFWQTNFKMHLPKKHYSVNCTTLQQSCNNFIQPFLIIIIFPVPFSYRNSLSIRAQDRKLLYYSYSSLVWVLLMKQSHNQMKIMPKKTCIISLGLNYQEI